MLYIVATPIGNLKDITLRALEVMRSVDLIACEDTRRTRILLEHYGITVATTSYFQHNRIAKGQRILEMLKEGKSVALVSDAGTPGILDPGYHIINLALQNNIGVTVIPGPSAFIVALVASGKPAHRFIFEGFLPAKAQARRNRLKELAQLKCTVVLYESCHRILATLADIRGMWPEREVVVARELTKKFEEILRASPEDIISRLKSAPVRGEFVVVI
ncbi:MAG: 16S rRNA (cytidine(1402)-2'-O)-methyltransferase [Candidatus Omnitrophota bacterium]|jgi:16S rRNA (cytidine1402-2'-O)-methyltransferase